MGAPKKHIFNPDEHCQSLIKYMGRGRSFVYWAVKVAKISRATAYIWLKNHPELKEAYAEGYWHGLAYYEEVLQIIALGTHWKKRDEWEDEEDHEDSIIIGSRPNLGAVIFTLKTRFQKEYMDLIDLLGDGGIYSQDKGPLENVSDSDLKEKLRLALMK